MKGKAKSVGAAFREHLAAFRDARPLLESFHNVWDCDVGFRFRKNRVVGSLAFRVFIHGQKEHRRPGRRGMVPPKLLGFETDIISGRFGPHQAPGAAVLSGDAIAIDPRNAGSLGLILGHPAHPEARIGITAWHVAQDVGAVVARLEGVPVPLGPVIGFNPTLRTSFFKVPENCPIAMLPGGRTLRRIMTWAELQTVVEQKIKVVKFGAATGRTMGRLTGVNPVSEAVTVSSIDGSTITQPGDSGAVWFARDGSAVALHQGGSEEHSNSVSVGQIADAFHLFIPPPA